MSLGSAGSCYTYKQGPRLLRAIPLCAVVDGNSKGKAAGPGPRGVVSGSIIVVDQNNRANPPEPPVFGTSETNPA